MKQLGYYFFKGWISLALFFYYKKVRVVGLDNVPKNTAVLFLSNHQNALLDILLIATRCQRKPWYLTRADVFKNGLFRPLFRFLQMLPVYRIRDGKANLSKNWGLFEDCARLLLQREAILLFPEANHSLRRQVRPLSKGFTRIIEATLTIGPNLDFQLIPIGQNYQNPTEAGDEAAIYFGKPIKVQEFKGCQDIVGEIKKAVFEQLKELTTHIDEDYENNLLRLKQNKTDFIYPERVNKQIQDKQFELLHSPITASVRTVLKTLFYTIHLPMVLLWRLVLKPKVPEPEFEATFRFGFVLLAYPLFYLLTFVVLTATFSVYIAILCITGHLIVNLLLVKLGINGRSRHA